MALPDRFHPQAIQPPVAYAAPPVYVPQQGRETDFLDTLRKLWRHRGPDIQAYTETVARYGLDVITGGQGLAAAIKRSPATFNGCELCRADETTPNGFITTGPNSVKQCSCVVEYRAIQQELRPSA